MYFKSQKQIDSFLEKNSVFRRGNFSTPGEYLDFVFLCGKTRQKVNDNRELLEKNVLDDHGKITIYSEDLFDIFSNLNLDLLTVEEILLDISSGVVLILESYGSACELGAFSISNTSSKKMIVINDKKRKNDKSFINNGPIAKIEAYDKNHVLYSTFDDDGILSLDDNIYNELSLIHRKSFESEPIQSDGGKRIVKNLGFLACLIFDYVKTFGVLLKKDVEKKILFMINETNIDNVEIKLQSGNNPFDGRLNGAMDIFLKIPEMFVKTNLFRISTNKNIEYYYINYDLLSKLKKDPKGLTSILFSSTFSKMVKTKKEIFKILNLERKEGFKIW